MRNSLLSEGFLSGNYIILLDMQFPSYLIKKVYAFLKPNSLEQAIQFMSQENNIYQHNFYINSHKKEKNKYYICGESPQYHINYNENIIDDIADINQNNKENYTLNNLEIECPICGDNVSSSKMIEYKKCGHKFCEICWFNYINEKIANANVGNIKCMNYECNEDINEELTMKIINKDKNLIEKFNKFKEKIKILIMKT